MDLKFVSLGGLGEIGKNMMAFEIRGRILLVDAGVKFPDEKTPGVDLIIPDFTYLIEQREKIVGLVLTHGHEDHVGAIPYLLQKLPMPVYGTDLTLGLAEGRTKELGVSFDKHIVHPGDEIHLDPFSVEFLQVTHSVPASVSLAIKTPLGIIVHSGDFKIDQNPVDQRKMDFPRISALAKQGVLCLFCDSTNAERPGYAPSELAVKGPLEEIFRAARNRIIVTTFASNVHRIQQIIATASLFGRKVLVDGMSLNNVVTVAVELGYLQIPSDILVQSDELSRLQRNQVVIITTGSQGEPLSALSRIASGEHKKIAIEPGDTVIFSADPIPGNETLVAETIDKLFRKKAEVIYGPSTGVHVSGHGFREDIKMMINLVQPRYFIPIHGEYRHLVRCSRIAEGVGIHPDRIFLVENGEVVNFTAGKAFVQGKVKSSASFVDGQSLDTLESSVLRDRRILCQEGFVNVSAVLQMQKRVIQANPTIHSRGFLPEKDLEQFANELTLQIVLLFHQCMEQNMDRESCEQKTKDAVLRFFSKRLKRRPLVIVSITDLDEKTTTE